MAFLQILIICVYVCFDAKFHINYCIHTATIELKMLMVKMTVLYWCLFISIQCNLGRTLLKETFKSVMFSKCQCEKCDCRW